jgi:hypothetical protein
MVKILEKEKLIEELVHLGIKYQDYFFIMGMRGKWIISKTKGSGVFFSCPVSDFYPTEIWGKILKGRDDDEFLETCRQMVEKKIEDIEGKQQGKETTSNFHGLSVIVFFVTLFIVSIILIISGLSPETEKQKVRRLEIAEQKRIEEENCKNSLSCWADRFDSDAYRFSRERIEKFARYDFRWVDSWTRSKISYYRWLNVKEGTVTYIGDAIQFQNGFGAWQNYIYEIDYDPSSKYALDIRVKPGRL